MKAAPFRRGPVSQMTVRLPAEAWRRHPLLRRLTLHSAGCRMRWRPLAARRWMATAISSCPMRLMMRRTRRPRRRARRISAPNRHQLIPPCLKVARRRSPTPRAPQPSRGGRRLTTRSLTPRQWLILPCRPHRMPAAHLLHRMPIVRLSHRMPIARRLQGWPPAIRCSRRSHAVRMRWPFPHVSTPAAPIRCRNRLEGPRKPPQLPLR
jgi:hypothetical protein